MVESRFSARNYSNSRGNMARTFVNSVLSTRKQLQRYDWARNVISFICAAPAFHAVGGVLGAVVALAALVLAHFTISPIVALFFALSNRCFPER
jgi:hypothetical protein